MLQLEVMGPVAEAEDFVKTLQKWFYAIPGRPYLSIDKKTSLIVLRVLNDEEIDEWERDN